MEYQEECCSISLDRRDPFFSLLVLLLPTPLVGVVDPCRHFAVDLLSEAFNKTVDSIPRKKLIQNTFKKPRK
jgi:hypothetical protein